FAAVKRFPLMTSRKPSSSAPSTASCGVSLPGRRLTRPFRKLVEKIFARPGDPDILLVNFRGSERSALHHAPDGAAEKGHHTTQPQPARGYHAGGNDHRQPAQEPNGTHDDGQLPLLLVDFT